MIECFYHDRVVLKDWIKRRPPGYLFNHFGGKDPKNNKRHRSDCPTIFYGKGDIANVPNVCSRDLDELHRWLIQNRRQEDEGWSKCKPCVNSGRLPC